MNIVNLSEFDPHWNWLAPRFATRPELHWSHRTPQDRGAPAWLPRRRTVQRVEAAWATRRLLSGADAVLVSHGPRMSMYGAFANRARTTHLAYSFNFTTLPDGPMRSAMALAFRSVRRFVVFSQMERQLYSRHFDIDPARIDMIHWAAQPPQPAGAPLVAGDYLCAIGSQGRDYRLLVAAMRAIPHVKLVVVGTAESMQGVEVPANVDLRLHLPLADAMNILAHSRFMVLPLSGSQVPCGHVTLVSAMHMAKAIVATHSEGITDYLRQGVNGLMTDPGDATGLARAIAALIDDPDQCKRLGAAGCAFASLHCVEDNVVRYFDDFVARHAPSTSTRAVS